MRSISGIKKARPGSNTRWNRPKRSTIQASCWGYRYPANVTDDQKAETKDIWTRWKCWWKRTTNLMMVLSGSRSSRSCRASILFQGVCSSLGVVLKYRCGNDTRNRRVNSGARVKNIFRKKKYLKKIFFACLNSGSPVVKDFAKQYPFFSTSSSSRYYRKCPYS